MLHTFWKEVYFKWHINLFRDSSKSMIEDRHGDRKCVDTPYDYGDMSVAW